VRFTGATTGGNSLIRDNGTTVSIGTAPTAAQFLNVNRTQLTATGDGQSTVYAYRDRDTRNDGTGYSVTASNRAVGGYNYWGDNYTFGVGGYSFNDYQRTGGVLGANSSGTYWGSLGYKNSASATYGVYGSAGYASGAGYLPTKEMSGIGGGFFGDLVGTVSHGAIIGQLNAGELMATYNIGDVYTSGRQVEMVNTGEQRTAAYSVTSTDVKVYQDGKISLVNGSAYVAFDQNYKSMLGQAPVVTATPMGACNGVYISAIDKNGFTLTEQNNGSSSVEIAWISVGTRIDASNKLEIPAVVRDGAFDTNLKAVMYDDGNKEGSAEGMWWDGATLQFGTIPASALPKTGPKTPPIK
jgi:hypothetical protein